jgi:predicted RND superfamily exporter protein
MKRISEAVIRHRRLIVLLTLLLCVVSVFAAQTVKVNYDLSVYLPREAPTVKALDQIKTSLPNLQLYLPGLSIQEALREKERLAALPGVEDILWLDDVTDLRDTPLDMQDEDMLSQSITMARCSS